MGFMRSEKMAMYQLTIPKDDIWKVIESLGKINLAHFLDLNKGEQPFSLPYANQIRRCDETERRILFLINKCKENRIIINKPKSPEVFSRNISAIESDKKKGHDLLFDAIEEEVSKNQVFIAEQIQAIQEMKDGIAKLKDYQKVVAFVKQMLPQLHGAIPSNVVSADVENNVASDSEMLQYVSGTIQEREKERMKRMLFRITKGMALTHFEEFEYEGETRCAYLVMFSGVGRLREKIQKLCDTFMGQRFEIPDANQLGKVLEDNAREIAKSEEIYKMSQTMLQSYLYDMNSATNEEQSETSTLEVYKWFVAKEKAIYSAINMMTARQSTYIGFIWAPEDQESFIKEHLKDFSTTEFNRWITREDSGLEPPTYFKSNDMIFVHQILSDMYNVASYEELNPAVFSIITFPFLFAVMYGDWGHGMVFFVLGAVLTLGYPWLKNNPGMKDVLKARYFILMIGFFACYNGLLYNEFFAISNDFFGTCYTADFAPDQNNPSEPSNRVGCVKENCDCTYAFGMDPGWSLDPGNKLTFMNTAKEKISVIIAFFHLNFGITCKVFNSVYFGRWSVLVFDAITGYLIFFGFIGVMITMIYVKWWYPVDAYTVYEVSEMCVTPDPVTNEIIPNPDMNVVSPNVCNGLSVITITINNFMGIMGSSTSPSLYWIQGQQKLANVALALAMVCIPLMLCVIPCMVFCKPHAADHDADAFDEVRPHNNEEENQLIQQNQNNEQDGMKEFENLLNVERRHTGGHGDTFGDVFVWQMVETIEFVLGTISCTASYLRLWALSLAHGQLGEVFLQIFFQQLLLMGQTNMAGMSAGALVFYNFIVCFGYMCAVIGVLLGMDAMEVLLHTVRLHWVEFMKQFFDGKGYPYVPFSFNEVFEAEMARSD